MAQGIVSSGYTDLTHFYDCSWTIYTCSWNPPTTFRRDDLTRQIQTDLRRRSSDDDDLPERSGELQECTAESISIRLGRDSVSSGLLISVVYDKALHKFVIYGSEGVAVSLLLVKAPAAVTKKVFTVLSDALDMSFPLLLRLPSSLLQSQLESYLKKLDGADSGHTTSLVTDVLHDLKVSIAFEAPIAPSLRSLEIDVPPTTIRIMKNESPQGQFMKLLAEHVRSQTGLNLPAATTTDNDSLPMSIAKISCGAFAISTDGRLKFNKKAVDAADLMQKKDVLSRLNAQMLDAIMVEAAKAGN